jgi:ribose 5-phosphate isomerase B
MEADDDDDMNVMCLGGRVTGYALTWDLVQIFLNAHFKGAERFERDAGTDPKNENK